jgi:nitrogen regulatory protein PII
LNLSGMTVTEVRGRQTERAYRGHRGKNATSACCQNAGGSGRARSIAEEAIRAIVEAARTGEIGDGRVFVLPVEQSYRIRTGEREI